MDDNVWPLYLGIIWFIGLSVIWLIIFNYIKTARVQSFFIVFGIVLLLLTGISSYTTYIAFKDNKEPVHKASAIGSLSAHILFAMYSLYTGFSSASPFMNSNTNGQRGGKYR